MKKIYMYVLDTMADWENGYLLQGLTLQKMAGKSRYELQTVSTSKKAITTSGGVTIVPDITINPIKKCLNCLSHFLKRIYWLLLFAAPLWD